MENKVRLFVRFKFFANFQQISLSSLLQSTRMLWFKLNLETKYFEQK